MPGLFLIAEYLWVHFACYARAITGGIRQLHRDIGYARP